MYMNVFLWKVLEIGVGLILNILEMEFFQLIDKMLDNLSEELNVSYLMKMTYFEFYFLGSL